MVDIDPQRLISLANGHLGAGGYDVQQRLCLMIAIAANAIEIGDCDYVVIDGYKPSPPLPLG